MPTVSVVIPVRNGAKDLACCLESLQGSRADMLELIVVDDGSSDQFRAIAEAWGATFVQATGSGGPAAARNQGAALAKGELLVFFDADVCVHLTTLAQIQARFTGDATIDALIGSYDDQPAAPGFISQYKNLQHHYVHQHGNTEAATFWSGCGAIRAEIFRGAGGFTETYRRPCIETKFSVEKSTGKSLQAAATPSPAPADAPAESGSVPDIPERFVAYVFDDAHLQFDELARVRAAAIRQLANLAKTDRAAFYTTSGQNQVDFTGDTGKLRDALRRMQPRSTSTRSQTPECPEIGEYMADRIANRSDTVALNAAALEYAICQVGPAAQITPAQQAAFQALLQSAKNSIPDLARRVLTVQAHDTQVTFTVLKDVLHRMSAMPGQRIVVMISPGFITPEEQEDKDAAIDSAIPANVLISALDARGLWTDATADASHAGGRITEAVRPGEDRRQGTGPPAFQVHGQAASRRTLQRLGDPSRRAGADGALYRATARKSLRGAGSRARISGRFRRSRPARSRCSHQGVRRVRHQWRQG